MQQHMHNSVDLGHHCLLFSKPIFVFWLQFQLSGLWQWRISRTVSQSTAVNLLVANSQAQALSAPIIGLPVLWLVTLRLSSSLIGRGRTIGLNYPGLGCQGATSSGSSGLPGKYLTRNTEPQYHSLHSANYLESPFLIKYYRNYLMLCGIDQRYESRVLCRVYTELMFPYIRR